MHTAHTHTHTHNQSLFNFNGVVLILCVFIFALPLANNNSRSFTIFFACVPSFICCVFVFREPPPICSYLNALSIAIDKLFYNFMWRMYYLHKSIKCLDESHFLPTYTTVSYTLVWIRCSSRH